MAIQFTDFSSKPLLDAPGKDIFEDILKGYQMGKEPANMKRDADAKDLANKLKKLEVDHKPREYQLNDEGKGYANRLAQLDVEHKPKQYDLDDKAKDFANQLQQKALDTYDARWKIEKDQKEAANALKNKEYADYDQKQELERRLKESTIAKNLADHKNKGNFVNTLEYRNNLDPNSPNYDKDYKATTAYLKKLATASGMGTDITSDGQAIKIELPEGKEGYIPALGKMKPGWLKVEDEHGNFIGANVPLEPKQIEQWKAKEKFDVIQPFINTSLSEYSGQGSWDNYVKDANNYNKDPAAKKRIDDFHAARKLISIGSTTENARIGGHATNAQLSELKNTLDTSEVHKKLEAGSTALLPKGYALSSGKIFKDYLDKVEDVAKKNIPAYEFRALNPSKNVINNDSKQKELASSIASIQMPQQQTKPKVLGSQNGMTALQYNGKTYNIPDDLVNDFMRKPPDNRAGG